MKTVENKVAIVTGAASGIGKASALLLAREGAKVVVSDIAEDTGQAVVQEIKDAGGEAVFVKADTAQPEDHQHLVKETIATFGALHTAINNAGIGGVSEMIADYPVEEWQKVININLSGVFYGMKYQLPELVKAGGGNIINMASILGQVGFSGSGAYVAAKHALVGLTKTAALEYADRKVRVNAVGPGFIYSGLVNEETMGREVITNLEQQHALGRLGEPNEVAELCLFLASDKASFITGSYYPVNGGYLAR